MLYKTFLKVPSYDQVFFYNPHFFWHFLLEFWLDLCLSFSFSFPSLKTFIFVFCGALTSALSMGLPIT
jgi:hypothetical protein